MDPGISKENVAEAVRLYVFPGKPGPKFAEKERFVTIYEDWKRYWADLLAGIGSGDRIPSDEFFKQDYVAALMHGHEIVGTICINSYDSECGLFEHTFFQTFDDDFYRHMQGRNIRHFFSVQWFMVHEKFSPQATGVSFPSILVGISHKLYQRHMTETSAMIAMSRVDIAASNTARKFGWETVGATKILHNVPCDQLVLVGNPRPHPKKEIENQIRALWTRKIEPSRGYSHGERPPQKIAA